MPARALCAGGELAPAVLASCRFAGKTYGLPVTAGSCGLWYNRDMFEHKGIPAGRDDFPQELG